MNVDKPYVVNTQFGDFSYSGPNDYFSVFDKCAKACDGNGQEFTIKDAYNVFMSAGNVAFINNPTEHNMAQSIQPFKPQAGLFDIAGVYHSVSHFVSKQGHLPELETLYVLPASGFLYGYGSNSDFAKMKREHEDIYFSDTYHGYRNIIHRNEFKSRLNMYLELAGDFYTKDGERGQTEKLPNNPDMVNTAIEETNFRAGIFDQKVKEKYGVPFQYLLIEEAKSVPYKFSNLLPKEKTAMAQYLAGKTPDEGSIPGESSGKFVAMLKEREKPVKGVYEDVLGVALRR